MNYDNPAARLLKLLQLSKQEPGDQNCRKVWNKLLKSNDNLQLLISRIGKVMELPQTIVLAMKEVDLAEDQSLRHWLGQVNLAFTNQNLHGTWDSFIGQIDDHSINYLKLTSQLLEIKSNVKALADDAISSHYHDISALLKEIIESDAPLEIKKFLTRSLKRILTSIDEYELTGALPIFESIESTYGHAAHNTNYRDFLTNVELGKKVLDTLQATANVLAVSIGIPQLSNYLLSLAN